MNESTQYSYFFRPNKDGGGCCRRTLIDQHGFEYNFEDILIPKDDYTDILKKIGSQSNFDTNALAEEYWNTHRYIKADQKEDPNRMSADEYKAVDSQANTPPSYPEQIIDLFREICHEMTISNAQLSFGSDGEAKISFIRDNNQLKSNP